MAVRLTRTRTVALVAAVLVCAGVAVGIWRDPMAPLRNGFALQPWSVQGSTGVNLTWAFSGLTLY